MVTVRNGNTVSLHLVLLLGTDVTSVTWHPAPHPPSGVSVCSRTDCAGSLVLRTKSPAGKEDEMRHLYLCFSEGVKGNE